MNILKVLMDLSMPIMDMENNVKLHTCKIFGYNLHSFKTLRLPCINMEKLMDTLEQEA